MIRNIVDSAGTHTVTIGGDLVEDESPTSVARWRAALRNIHFFNALLECISVADEFDHRVFRRARSPLIAANRIAVRIFAVALSDVGHELYDPRDGLRKRRFDLGDAPGDPAK